MVTLKEIKEWLVNSYDECELLDLLGLDCHDIVGAFEELIEERADYLASEMELFYEKDESDDGEAGQD